VTVRALEIRNAFGHVRRAPDALAALVAMLATLREEKGNKTIKA
jgi:hypothetical protein